MTRVKFLKIKPQDFFREVNEKTGFTLEKMADVCKVNRRTLSDWRSGKYLMPVSVFRTLVKISGIESPRIQYFPDYWHAKTAARKGGLAVYKKYGKVPGWTRDASVKGAKMAAAVCRKRGIDVFNLKNVALPEYSVQLAEFVGIILGDGGLTRRQIVVTLHKIDDKDFAVYIKLLAEKLFGVTPSLNKRHNKRAESVLSITISRTKLVEFFVEMGLCVGSKIRQQVDVPLWIRRSQEFTKACLRGLFDTDGCFYLDKHRYKDKVYYNCAMNFTNRSLPILSFFKSELERFGLHPTQKTKFSIFLRKESEIIKYFRIIGSSNLKHLNKFKGYFQEKQGEVPKFG